MIYEDILYEIKDGVATLTINRPDKLNAFRAQTCEKLIHAFQRAGWDHIADLSSLVLRRSACSTAPRKPRKGYGRFGKNASRSSAIDSLPPPPSRGRGRIPLWKVNRTGLFPKNSLQVLVML